MGFSGLGANERGLRGRVQKRMTECAGQGSRPATKPLSQRDWFLVKLVHLGSRDVAGQATKHGEVGDGVVVALSEDGRRDGYKTRKNAVLCFELTCVGDRSGGRECAIRG
jgi:hypothetical protein